MEYIYKGFSSKQYQHDKNFIMTDVDLVKEDLINHIFTRRGERVRMAQFGSIIPDIIFEPLNADTVIRIRDDMKLIFDYDPRVELVELLVMPVVDENAIVILADLNYVELGKEDRLTLRIEFQTNS